MDKGIEKPEFESKIFAEYDLAEVVDELREDLRDAGVSVSIRAVYRTRKLDAIRVRGTDDDWVKAEVRRIASQYRGLAWHERLKGYYANFVLEFAGEEE